MSEPSTTDFGAMFEPHRREVRAHCYRMLGSIADADDATQDAMLRAFKAQQSLQSGKAARAWLYQIATNVCLDRLARRPASVDPSVIVDPCPDTMWESTDAGPETRISARQSVALAFMVALQELPPRERAALLLRDVLGWSAAETAELLDASEASVNSALQRAREKCPTTEKRPKTLAPSIEGLLARYLRAWESGDAGVLTMLLREDARLTMPPGPIVTGPEAIAEFLRPIWAQLGEVKVLPVPMFGGFGFAAYSRKPGSGEPFTPVALQHVEVSDEGLVALHSYLRPQLFAAFGLPDTLA